MKRWIRSAHCAWAGLCYMLRTQRNARIHGVASVLVIALAAWLRVNASDWRWLILAMVMVWSVEAMNTAIECLADRISSERNARIGHAKDAAAGAVLCAAFGAALIGLLVLGPPLLAALRQMMP